MNTTNSNDGIKLNGTISYTINDISNTSENITINT